MGKLVSVGKVHSSHGIKGELFVEFFGGEVPENLETFILQLPRAQKQFTVKTIRKHKKGFIVTTKEIADRNESDTYVGGFLQITENRVVSEPGEAIFLQEISGFSVEDEELGNIGVITSFKSNGPQDLIVVTRDEKEYLVPLVKDFIIEIVWKDKKLKMRFPPGLLEIE